jgi:hypothetical protein
MILKRIICFFKGHNYGKDGVCKRCGMFEGLIPYFFRIKKPRQL